MRRAKWHEVAPYVWQDTESNDRMAVDMADGRISRFAMEPYAPIMVFERLPWWRSPTLLLPLLCASLFVLLMTVLAWPVSALVRRYYRTPYRLTGSDARAHRVIRIVALAMLVTLGAALGLVVGMLSNLSMTSTDSDGLVIGVRLLATLVLPIGAVLAVWNAWQVLRSARGVLGEAVGGAVGTGLPVRLVDRHQPPLGRVRRELLIACGWRPGAASRFRTPNHCWPCRVTANACRTGTAQRAAAALRAVPDLRLRVRGDAGDRGDVATRSTHRGRGEAAGVYYLDDRPGGMLATLEAHRADIEAGIDREVRAIAAAGRRRA